MKIVNYAFLIFIFMSMFSCSKDGEIRDNNNDNTDHPKHAVYQAMSDKYYQSTQAPGTVMLVLREGQDTWMSAKGVSDIDQNIPMTTDTRFRIGSITKVYVAAYILYLVDHNKFQLDNLLSDLLPEVAGQIPGSHSITLRQLLAHLSGIIDPSGEVASYSDDLLNDPEAFGSYTIPDLLEKYVYGKELHFTPGTQYQYSNTGYWLLQLIAEKTMGKSLPALLDEAFFQPLNLKNTFLDKRANDQAAKGYAIIEGGGLADVTLYDKADSDGKASGGIISNAEEVSIFMNALFNGGLISAGMLNEMKTVQFIDPGGDGYHYGLGMELWKLKEITGFGHNGSSTGYETNVLYFDHTRTLIITFKNKGGSSDKSFFYDIAR